MNVLSLYDSQKKPALLTPWSIIHFLSGVIAGLLVRHLNLDFFWSLVIYILMNIIYETKDIMFTNGTNSWQNTLVDIIVGILGFLWVTQTVVSTKMVIALSTILYLIFASPMSAEKTEVWSFFTDSWYTRD